MRRAGSTLAIALAAIVAVLAFARGAAAEHVKLTLREGEKVEGELIEQSATSLSVKPEVTLLDRIRDRILFRETPTVERRDVQMENIRRVDYGQDGYFWFLFGICGNAVWASRFLYQWYVSERAGKSVIPVGFWYISMVGSVVFLVFSIHLLAHDGWRDGTPIFLGYAFNTIPYARNLMLIKKEKAAGGH